MDKQEMQAQRQRYMNNEISHADYYLWLADGIGITKADLPVSIDRIRQSQDEHLNDISLVMWDRRDPIIRAKAYHHKLPWSLSDTVCCLKAVARREAIAKATQ